MESWSSGMPVPLPFPNGVYNRGKQFNGGLILEWGAVECDREEEITDTIPG